MHGMERFQKVDWYQFSSMGEIFMRRFDGLPLSFTPKGKLALCYQVFPWAQCLAFPLQLPDSWILGWVHNSRQGTTGSSNLLTQDPSKGAKIKILRESSLFPSLISPSSLLPDE